MIISEAERQNRPNANFAIDGNRLRLSLADTENGNLRRVDDWREMAAANAPLVGNRERAALKLLKRNFPLPGFFRDRVQLLRSPIHAMEQAAPRQIGVAIYQRLAAAAFRGNSREPVVKLHAFRSRR